LMVDGLFDADKAETNTRIVTLAARRVRNFGREGIGVADVMKEAALRRWFTNISMRAMNWWLRRGNRIPGPRPLGGTH